MSTYLPKDVQRDLDAARIAGLKKTSRFSVRTGSDRVDVLHMWDNGFSVAAEEAIALRGLVDLFEGDRHLAQCLIIASEADGGMMRYEFKRATEAHDRAPLDFFRAPDAPVALIAKA